MDVDELEDHLRTQVAELKEAGLDEEEAFLIAVKRLGDLDSLSREYAREYSERLWKRLVVAPEAGEGGVGWRKEALVALGLAVAAGAAIKVPELFGLRLDDDASNSFYLRNFSLNGSTRLSNRSSTPRTRGRRSVIVPELIANRLGLPYPLR